MPSKRQQKRARHGQAIRKAPTRPPVSNRTSQSRPIEQPTPPTSGGSRINTRGALFIAVCAVCLLVAGAAIAWAVVRDGSGNTQAAGGPMDNAGSPGTISRLSQPGGAVMFRSVLPGDHWNQVGVVPMGAEEGGRTMVPLRCLRVHFDGGRGLCLAEGDGPPGSYTAYILDADLKETGAVGLGGLPSRTRVSPDGRYGATTSFVTGHSYAEDGFSTETLLIDLDEGEEIANMEEFTAYKDGEKFANEDFNYWGITFMQDSNLFYATLATGDKTYLVHGDIAAREVEVLRENVECPSISPDNTRLAFKKKVGGDLSGPIWQFHVLDLTTMTETPLSETRSIDDQIMWLGNDQVLYGDNSDTWVMPADGSGHPTRYMSRAISPVFIERSGDATAAEGSSKAPGAEILELPETDLGVSISMPNSLQAGIEQTYTLTVTNHGKVEATGLILHHTVPDNATIGAVTAIDPPGVSYGCSSYPDESRVQCTTPSLAPGASLTVSVAVTPSRTGPDTISADIGAAEVDTNAENDRIEAEVVIRP